MATYDPTNWKTGDVITATKLNNMETGIAGALQTSGGTMTGNITMSRDSYLDGESLRFHIIQLEGNQDFNTITQSGVYARAGGIYDDENGPSDATTNFALVVIAQGTFIIKQIFFYSGTTAKIAVRFIYPDSNGDASYGKWSNISFSS